MNGFEWHGRDRKAAIKRAQAIKGVVIESWLPGNRGCFGYYSDVKGTEPRGHDEAQVWPRRDR